MKRQISSEKARNVLWNMNSQEIEKSLTFSHISEIDGGILWEINTPDEYKGIQIAFPAIVNPNSPASSQMYRYKLARYLRRQELFKNICWN